MFLDYEYEKKLISLIKDHMPWVTEANWRDEVLIELDNLVNKMKSMEPFYPAFDADLSWLEWRLTLDYKYEINFAYLVPGFLEMRDKVYAGS